MNRHVVTKYWSLHEWHARGWGVCHHKNATLIRFCWVCLYQSKSAFSTLGFLGLESRFCSPHTLPYCFIFGRVVIPPHPSLLFMDPLAPSYCHRPPALLHLATDVKQGHLGVPAIYLLPFRRFTWESAAEINSFNSQRSVGTSHFLPHALPLVIPPPDACILSVLCCLVCFCVVPSCPLCLRGSWT